MAIEISSKIKEVRIQKADVGVSDVVNVPDVDPLYTRIDARPEGRLEAVSDKIVYNTQQGKCKVYVITSFMPVSGIIDGNAVTIERPIEFFIPSGQLSTEYQWITATMRSLSLAARGGYITRALQDLRKVAWDKGPVRCGKNEYGKPLYHDSEVAAFAWSIQQILHQRGFLEADGEQRPIADILEDRQLKVVEEVTPAEVEAPPAVATERPSVGDCPDCDGPLQLLDGCPTCVEGCGWSKCG